MGSEEKAAGIGKFYFLLISSFSFLFVSLFALSSGIYYSNRSKEVPNIKEKTLGVSAEELQLQNDRYPKYIGSSDISLSSKSVLAIDIESGVVLFEKNSREPVMPASTSKVITALVALDSYDIKQKIVIPKLEVEGQKINLKEGEVLSVEDLLYGLLVASANDTAEVLAYNYPGGRNIFIAQMNSKAQGLGLRSSVFMNPTGLDEEGQSTTAEDLIKASFYAMQNPIFEKIVGTKRYDIVGPNNEVTHRIYNINQLLGEVEGVRGVKTGKTDGAMENLITYIERENSKVMIAVLGSNNRFEDTVKLIDWIYKSYTWSN
jgi:D-alanyl-D-alanine carboxypeptidase (penicillin-binding protein 5/6)